MADALTMLSSMWDKPTGTVIKPLVIMKIRAACYGGESVMSTQIGQKRCRDFMTSKSLLKKGSIQMKQL